MEGIIKADRKGCGKGSHSLGMNSVATK